MNELNEFPNNLNNNYLKIKFTMQIEIYVKKTHTNRYLNHKDAGPTITKLADTDSQKQGLLILKSAQLQSEHFDNTIRPALRARKPKIEKSEEEIPLAKTYLLHRKGTPGKIRKSLKKRKYDTTFNTNNRINNIFPIAKRRSTWKTMEYMRCHAGTDINLRSVSPKLILILDRSDQ